MGRHLLEAWTTHRKPILAIAAVSFLLAAGLICLSLVRQGTPFFYQVY